MTGPAEAWSEFCRALEKAGQVVVSESAPDAPLDRAEGFRYLSRLTREMLYSLVDNSDPDFPRLHELDLVKIGADNPDNVYLSANIRGDRDYRITGTRGSIAYFSIGSKANRYAKDGTMASTGELSGTDLVAEPDGTVEIIASRTRQGRNWLPLAPDSTGLVVRQTYLDRTTEAPGQWHIERIGGPAEPGELSPEFLAKALQRTAMAVHGTAATFAGWADMFAARPNELPDFGQQMFQRAGGDPEICYLHGYWTLRAGQAWLIETEVPACPYWNFQLDNWWMESLDNARRITINKHTARIDDDGRLRIIVSEADPGVDWGNWIDTCGHDSGTALLRWLGAETNPIPTCHVVDLSTGNLPERPEGEPVTTTSTALRLDDLLSAAKDKVGLTDFGDDWFVEPLTVLLTALNNEARLSELGLELTRHRLTALLVDRLRLRGLQREHPEIADVQPVVAAEICGLPRTGSTLLHRLLAASPKLTSTLSWETSYPIPFPGEGPEAPERKRRAQEKMRLFLEYSPDFGDIHSIEWDGPEEDDRTFTSMSFESFYWIPSYGDWLRGVDQSKAYDELRQWLQVLQWQQPARAGKRWVLKSPHHLMATSAVLDTFDDCRIVMTHRSPVSAVPSYASMVRSISAQYSDDVDPLVLGPYWSARFAAALRDFAEVRAARPQRFVDVHYEAMLTEPARQAHRVLDDLGMAPDHSDSAAFESHLERDRRERHAAHSYTAEEYGLSEAQLERDFAFYTEAYLQRLRLL